MGSATSTLLRAALARFVRLWTGAPPAKILILGLDACGKTTLLYRIKRGADDTSEIATIATIGFNAEEIAFEDRVRFMAWDLGGSCPPLWHYYYEHTDAIVFVVDSVDRERLSEAIAVLHRVFRGNEALRKDTPLLVFANKQDRDGCMTLDAIRAALFASVSANSSSSSSSSEADDGDADDGTCTFARPWTLLPLVATTGSGIDAGLAWLADHVQHQQQQRPRRSPSRNSHRT